MVHALGLGLQVLIVLLRDPFRYDRHAVYHVDARRAHLGHLSRVVREQSHRLDVEVAEHCDGRAVFACVSRVAQREICVQCVQTCILEVVGLELLEKPDAATFLVEVNHKSGPILSNCL